VPAGRFDRDQPAGPSLLLTIPRDKREAQVIRGGHVHGIGAAEADLGGDVGRRASQPTVDGYQTQRGESQERPNRLVSKRGVPRSSRDRSRRFGQE
jgi:hypothetical protein